MDRANWVTGRRTTWGLGALTCLAVAAFAASVVPGVRSGSGFDPIFDGWLQGGTYVLLALVAVRSLVGDPANRRLRAGLVAALVLRATGFVLFLAVVRRSASPSYPSIADAAWLASSVLFVIGVSYVAWRHSPRATLTLVLDAVLGALITSGIVVSLLFETLVTLSGPTVPRAAVLTNLTYPILDVALLIVVVGVLVAVRFRASARVWAMAIGAGGLAVVDCVYFYQLVAGSFGPGSPLAVLSLSATALLAWSCQWLTSATRPPTDEIRGLGMVAVFATAGLIVLFLHAVGDGSLLGPVLVTFGIVVANARAFLTKQQEAGAVSDAMEEKQLELERFKALVEASSDFVAMADSDGAIFYVNPRGRAMVGIDPDLDVTGTTVADYLQPEAWEEWKAKRRPAILERGAWRGEQYLRHWQGGAPIPVTHSSFQIKHPHTGEPWLLATVQRDVTDLRMAESELLRFKALVEASSDFIALATTDGAVEYVNPAGRELVGLAAEVDVTTTTIADYLTEEGLRASAELEQPAVIEHGRWQGESTLRDLRGGPPTPVLINSFLIRHATTGEPWLLATSQRDISQLLVQQAEVQHLADQRQVLLTHLVEAQEDERARIAADVHDDSVQALAVVELRLQLLRTVLERESPALLEDLETLQGAVHGATERLRHLLFDLESPARNTDLRTALQEAAAYVLEDSVRWTVEATAEPDLPSAARVIAYRIAKEALVNARRHAHASRVTVRLDSVDDGLEVTVADDGRGFDTSQAMDRPGHLGMRGMHDRAAVAGGRVAVVSRLGSGTTVRIWLPGATDSLGPAHGHH